MNDVDEDWNSRLAGIQNVVETKALRLARMVHDAQLAVGNK